jgi:hypothetical protein
MEEHMKMNKYAALVFLVILLASGSRSLPAQKVPKLPTQKQIPRPLPLPCPDLKVSSIYVKLVSTTADDPHTDFPADKILLSYIVKNVGTLVIPATARCRTIIKRNNTVLVDGSIWTLIGNGGAVPPGGSVGAYDIPDTFPHGMKTTYSVEVITDINECATANNQLSYTIDEAQLHRQKNQGLPTNDQLPPPHVLSCPDVKVVSLQATLVSTELGDPAIANPRDTVRLEAILENAGHAEIPGGRTLRSKILKNSTATYYGEPISTAKAPGSRWTYGYTESFLHGVPTTFTYQVLSISDTRECTTANNQLSLTIDETQLHAAQAIKPTIRK